MARSAILLSTLVLGLLVAAVPAKAANQGPFDFYYFILRWPGAYCQASESGCCVPKYGYPAEDFSIESLMTFNEAENKAVVRCDSNSPFDPNKLDPIENSINHYWSNIKCPRTDGVNTWKSAWEAYGVCSGLRQLDYFKAALNLRKQAGILAALAEQDIYPDYKLYSTEKIKWAVEQKLKVRPGLSCKSGPFGKKQLYQVFLCVDKKDAETFIHCPVLPEQKCPDAVVFHPFYTWMLSTTSSANIQLPTDA